MSTTSLKLPVELKTRVAAVAAERGITPHAFMLGAIEESARAAELRVMFVADAQRARTSLLKSGKGFDADDVHAHIQNRIKGKTGSRPRPVSWRD